MAIFNLADGFGFAGVLANMAWPLMKLRKKMLAGQVLACGLMLTHFALLHAVTGALIMLLAGLQAGLAIPLGEHPRFKKIYLASLTLTPIVCYWSWQGFQSIFSSLALMIVCVANFQLNQVHQRMLLILAIFAWVVHNLMVGSTPGLISNFLALLVSGVMLQKVIHSRKLNAIADTTMK